MRRTHLRPDEIQGRETSRKIERAQRLKKKINGKGSEKKRRFGLASTASATLLGSSGSALGAVVAIPSLGPGIAALVALGAALIGAVISYNLINDIPDTDD